MNSDLPIGDVIQKHKGSYLELFTIMIFYLSDKDGNSRRIVTELGVSHFPDEVRPQLKFVKTLTDIERGALKKRWRYAILKKKLGEHVSEMMAVAV